MNVTFFCWLASSLARDLPKDSALLPPLCIWRMKKIQKPISSTNGAAEIRMLAQFEVWSLCTVTATFLASNMSTSFS